MRYSKIVLILLTLLTTVAFFSCDPCRYIEPSTGSSIVLFRVVDSLNQNVFDSTYTLENFIVTNMEGDCTYFKLDSNTNSALFFFDDYGAPPLDSSLSYKLVFSPTEVDTLRVEYLRTEEGKCGSWGYSHVHLFHNETPYYNYLNDTLTLIR